MRHREPMPLGRGPLECRQQGLPDPGCTPVHRLANDRHRVRRLLAGGGDEAPGRCLEFGHQVEGSEEELADALEGIAGVFEVMANPAVHFAVDIAVDCRREECIARMETPVDRRRAEVECDFEVPNCDGVAATLPGQQIGGVEHVGVRRLRGSAHLSHLHDGWVDK